VVIFCARQLAAALGLMRRLGRRRRPRPPLTSPRPNAERSISAVRLARDEEGRLARCLAPLTGDPDLAEIIVVDDKSSDRTAAVGEEHGAAGLAGRALPPGSAGKRWALDQGLRAARGDLVLLLDAKYLPRSGSHASRPLDRTCRHRENL
jgi:dolichol-phosphate mannosyltransferase